MNLKRGDIALVYFPHSDLTKIKLRPVLIVQANDLNTGLHQLVVAMVTSNWDRAGHPSRVAVRLRDPMAAGTGLKSDSVIMTDNLATIELSLIRKPIGSMAEMQPIDLALQRTLAL
jgi:mRNA interferase MazF